MRGPAARSAVAGHSDRDRTHPPLRRAVRRSDPRSTSTSCRPTRLRAGAHRPRRSTRMARDEIAAARAELERAERRCGRVSTIVLLQACCAVREGRVADARARVRRAADRATSAATPAPTISRMLAAVLGDWPSRSELARPKPARSARRFSATSTSSRRWRRCSRIPRAARCSAATGSACRGRWTIPREKRFDEPRASDAADAVRRPDGGVLRADARLPPQPAARQLTDRGMWLDIGRGQEMHVAFVEGFEVSRFEKRVRPPHRGVPSAGRFPRAQGPADRGRRGADRAAARHAVRALLLPRAGQRLRRSKSSMRPARNSSARATIPCPATSTSRTSAAPSRCW